MCSSKVPSTWPNDTPFKEGFKELCGLLEDKFKDKSSHYLKFLLFILYIFFFTKLLQIALFNLRLIEFFIKFPYLSFFCELNFISFFFSVHFSISHRISFKTALTRKN